MKNKTIHDYTLLHPLGEGGMAEVWYAENVLGNPAAIKILFKEFSYNEQVVQRFESEAKIMVKLKHQNIRKVISYGEVDDRPAIIMEYLEGEDLSAKLKRGSSYTNTELMHWWNQAVEALKHTHAQGVVHRDIKPSNLFVNKEGELKLLDFGIAKIKEGVTLTKTGNTLGTPLYMSPEQVKDSKHIDSTTDIYSLAVSFVQLVSRRIPYGLNHDASRFDIEMGIVHTPIDTTILPPPWNSLLQHYLHKDKTTRQPLRTIHEKDTATTHETTQVYTEATQVEQKPQPQLEPTEPTVVVGDPVTKNRTPIYIGIVAVLLVLVGVFVWQNIDKTFTETVNGTSFKMIAVEGGGFDMGSNDGEKNERPVHSVSISDFYMGETEVTHKQYIAFLNAKGINSDGSYGGTEYVYMEHSDCAVGYRNGKFYFKGSSDAKSEETPMIWVTWYGAKAYCDWLREKTGKEYRLPSEAEWEYAARGGNKSRGYTCAGSNNLDTVAWYDENSYDKGENHPDYGVQIVATKQANELGLYDMSGNVQEWCEDKWHDSYLDAPTDGSAWTSGSSSERIARGGSWFHSAYRCRLAHRNLYFHSYSNYSIGFRLALSTGK